MISKIFTVRDSERGMSSHHQPLFCNLKVRKNGLQLRRQRQQSVYERCTRIAGESHLVISARCHTQLCRKSRRSSWIHAEIWWEPILDAEENPCYTCGEKQRGKRKMTRILFVCHGRALIKAWKSFCRPRLLTGASLGGNMPKAWREKLLSGNEQYFRFWKTMGKCTHSKSYM